MKLQELSRADLLMSSVLLHAKQAVTLAGRVADGGDLVAFLEHFQRLTEPERRSLRAEVSTRCRDHRRARPIHDTWVNTVLDDEVPSALHNKTRDLLARGGRHDRSDWLADWAVHRFPIGPNHLSRTDSGYGGISVVQEPGAAARRLGWLAVSVALDDAPERSVASFAAGLSDVLRQQFLSFRKLVFGGLPRDLIDRELRLRLQSDLLNLQRQGAQGERLVDGLGAQLYVLGAGRRFLEEARFLLHRLPRATTHWHGLRITSVLRRPLSLQLRARKLVMACSHSESSPSYC